MLFDVKIYDGTFGAFVNCVDEFTEAERRELLERSRHMPEWVVFRWLCRSFYRTFVGDVYEVSEKR